MNGPNGNSSPQKAPITHKMLTDWAGPQVVRDAESLLSKGLVLEANYDPPFIRGAILWNNRELRTGLKMLGNGMVENQCPCYANRERGVICSHSIAIALSLVRRSADPNRELKYQEELRRASRLALMDESQYIRRTVAGTPDSEPASIRVRLPENWQADCRSGQVSLQCEALMEGKVIPLHEVPRHLTLALSKDDEAVLFVLEDICSGPAQGTLAVNRNDLINLIALRANGVICQTDGRPVTIQHIRLKTRLLMRMEPESGELVLTARTPLPEDVAADPAPFYFIAGRTGWMFAAGIFWPLENPLPEPYHGIYEGEVRVTRKDMLRFLRQELPMLKRYTEVESDISEDLFLIDPASPQLRLQLRGSPASLSATATAVYEGDMELILGKADPNGHFAIPDAGDLLRYTVRNNEAERKALRRLDITGLRGEAGDELASIVGKRDVLNFLGTHLPALRRNGWQVELQGRVAPFFESVEFATPLVRIHDEEGQNWFEVGFEFEDGLGKSLSHTDIQLALRKGDAFIERDGRTLLIDADAVESMQSVFADCAIADSSTPGHFRMSRIYGAFVKSSLDALDGIDIEDTPSWRQNAIRQNRSAPIETLPLDPRLEGILRAYQKDGINWLAFLEKNGFCGILADEMGLGKTLQTLAWLNHTLTREENRGNPALIICPTSLVDNWAEEAARYVPDLKVMTMSGADRHEKWVQFPETHMVITSYALLRRDLEHYLQFEFAVAVLDEAQHIKNHSTQNAQAAKQIKARNRLVLTGTPMENSVTDLWSIMDYLMPGYLGSHDTFRNLYEQPISRNGAEGESAQLKLRRKLHPFLLRRIKTEVAADLPPKIERIATCTLTTDQQMVYQEILNKSRRRISDMVAEQGFNRSRMEILTTLLRLRQICCHLDLLKLPALESKFPSAKMDLFFELLDEALDGGHRILVFSQFVSMLQILRMQLEQNQTPYCYLDGASKDRMDIVHRFNTRRDIPVFLISLKAGGTGLNLTGADMVIHFDPWWNPAVENQATDRAYRIGQKRTVYSIKLITKGTVEEKVLKLQEKKKHLINATIESDEKMIQVLNWEDIQEILNV
jgi:SNF2 family DNA or RNA helicase